MTMQIRCTCGRIADIHPAVLDALALLDRPPQQAVAAWSDGCDRCAPRSAMHEWGWTLAHGEHVDSHAGDREADATAPVNLALERMLRRRDHGGTSR